MVLGVYNLTNIVDHFDSRGLSRDIFYSIFKAKSSRDTVRSNSSGILSSKIFKRCATNKTDTRKRLAEFSPAILLDYLSFKSPEYPLGFIHKFPRIRLLHGTSDKSIPYYETLAFGQALTEFENASKWLNSSNAKNGDDASLSQEDISLDVTVKLLQGKTHLDPFVIDPMKGGRDTCVEEIVEVVLGDEAARAYSMKRNDPLQSPNIVEFGGQFSPF